MAGAPQRSTSNFAIDDKDLDDADLWAVIDSAAASRKPLLSLTNSASPLPPPNPRKTPRLSDGEVVQEEHWRSFPRPQKIARFAEMSPDGNSGAVVRQQSPRVSFPSPCASPEKGGMAVREMSPVFETSPVVFGGGEREIGRHSLAGPFPSVSLFRQYQSAAMAILDKSDYTVISGNPFIKKTGWRKISFYFNLSFEIKDKTIEYDDNRNVLRAEFVARAYMQGGRFCDGWGSCERREKRFQKPNHDIPSTAETRAKNKACQDLLGIGACRPGTGNGMR